MELWQALVLGVVQGLTEFAPISSSGHLVLLPWFLGWEMPSVAFDATLHLGTLVAVLLYFRRDCLTLLRAWCKSLLSRRADSPEARTAWLLLLATFPAALIGLLFEDELEMLFAAPERVGVLLLVTAVLLVAGELFRRKDRVLTAMTWLDALLIGLAQAMAIAPGISRSGATIAAGSMRGFQRAEAARFSFLLGIPIILGTGLYKLIELLRAGSPAELDLLFAAGFLAAAISGYLCIKYLLLFLQRRPVYLFAAYCAAFGLAAILLSLFR